MAEGTIMLLRVDLACHKCYRKIKKLLCKYPEIRNQEYLEKEDTVRITVVCCSPERIRQKLIRKGGKTIKSIEIRVPEKTPKGADQKSPESGKPKTTEKKVTWADQKPPESGKPNTTEKKTKEDQKQKGTETPKPAADNPKKVVLMPNVTAPVLNPVTGYPPMYPYGVCCKQCFGPCQCHHGYVIPYQIHPPSSYDGWPSGCRCDRTCGCHCEYYTDNYPSCTII